jgi:hypothetical protein
MPITPMTDLAERGWSVTPEPTWNLHLPEGVDAVEPIPGVVMPIEVRAQGPLQSLPAEAVQGATDSEVEGARVEVEAVYDAKAGRYRLRGLSITASDAGEVTGVLLRRVAPLSILRWVLPRVFDTDDGALTPWVASFVAPEMDTLRESAEQERPAPTIQDAATVYRLAEVVREPPAKAVATALGLQARTATNWIKRAKAQGLL